jgi:hypothetical protein
MQFEWYQNQQVESGLLVSVECSAHIIKCIDMHVGEIGAALKS